MSDDTTWFWEIVDARGLADVSSDEAVALREILDRSHRAEAEIEAISAAIGSPRFMDPPDGGDVSLADQVRRMRAELEAKEARLAALENGPAGLADAHTNPTEPDLSSLRKGAEEPCPHAPTYDAGLCCGHPDDCTFVSPSALVSGSREDGASLLRTIETLPDDFTDDGNCCAGKLKEPRP